jgi:hypothetical protein
MRSMMRSLPILLLALLIAACTSGTQVGRPDIGTLYTPALLQWLGAGRDVRVDVIGNPTSAPTSAWEQAVTDRLNATGWLPSARFTTNPGMNSRGNFHLAVAFDVPPTATAADACGRAIEPGRLASQGGRSILLMALCNGAREVNSVRAWTDAITQPDAPQLDPTLYGMLIAVLPRGSPPLVNQANHEPIFLP